MGECNHIWIANSGRGGEPVFKPNRYMGREPLMHVKCSLCNQRTWVTEEQWRLAIPVDDPEPCLPPHYEDVRHLLRKTAGDYLALYHEYKETDPSAAQRYMGRKHQVDSMLDRLESLLGTQQPPGEDS